MLAFVRGLPVGGPLHRAIDPAGYRWGFTEELLATLLEVVDYGNRNFIAANSEKGAQIPDPVVITRPWKTEEEKTEEGKPRMATSSEMKEFFRKKAG